MKINLKSFMVRLSLFSIITQSAIGFLLLTPPAAKASAAETLLNPAVTEINVLTDDSVEIYNPNSAGLSLAGYKIGFNGNDYTIKDGVVVDPHSTVVLLKDSFTPDNLDFGDDNHTAKTITFRSADLPASLPLQSVTYDTQAVNYPTSGQTLQYNNGTGTWEVKTADLGNFTPALPSAVITRNPDQDLVKDSCDVTIAYANAVQKDYSIDGVWHRYTAPDNFTTNVTGDGPHEVKAIATDAFGVASESSTSFTIDSLAPTVTAINYSKSVVKSGDNLVITAAFSEPIAETPAPQITLSGVVPPASMTRADATHYTFTYPVLAGDGVVNVSISGATDLVGHSMVATDPASSFFTLDNTAPTVTGVTDNQITNADVTITFSDFGTLNGTREVSPLVVPADGNYIFVASDAAGNATTMHFTIDKTAPTAKISYSKANGIANAGDNLVITATFDGPIADLPVPQITLSGAATLTPTNLTKVSDTQYTYTYLAASGDGLVNVSVSGAVDKAGNAMAAPATSSFNLATTPTMDIAKTEDGNGFVISYVTNLLAIYLQISDQSDFSHLVKVVGQSTALGAITITDLPKGVTYYFRLEALNGTVATGYSSSKTGYIAAPETVVATETSSEETTSSETKSSSASVAPKTTAPKVAATTPKADESADKSKDQTGDIKGTKDKKDDNNRNRNILVVIALLAIAGAAYYGYKRLPDNDETPEITKTAALKEPKESKEVKEPKESKTTPAKSDTPKKKSSKK